MILIDSREQWKEEIQTKLQSLHINAHVLKLENYADYVLTSDNKEVQNTMAIQRKTIGEVLSTKKDKKTGKKVSMMSEIRNRVSELNMYGVPWLLVEENGMFINSSGIILSKRGKLLYETGVKAQSYYNFLHSVERMGTTIKITSNWEQSVWWLYSLHQYIQKEHYPKHNRKYTQKEEVVGALMDIPGVGSEMAQQLYAAYELVCKPLEIVTPDMTPKTLKQNWLMRNSSDANPLMLKAFDKLLMRVKSVLVEQRLSKNVLMKQLKTRIIKNEALLNAFMSVLIEEGYLQKEQKGKYVYYSLQHKKKERKKQNNIIDNDDKWLEEADALIEQME